VSLVIQVKDLMHKPGTMKELTLEHSLTEDLGTEVIAVKSGTTIELAVRLESQPENEDDFFIEQDRVDLEQPLIDSVVPNLPIQPLCSEDCPGLCVDCGEKLDAGNHNHEKPIDPRFDALKDFGS